MKHNRSMKELVLEKHCFREREENPEPCAFKSPTNHTSVLFNYAKSNLTTSKNTQSQKQLFPSHMNLITSPKYILPKAIHKNNNSILQPVNKNISLHEQPKKPRILSKRHNSGFSEEFKLGKVLGKGRFGNVQMAYHNATGSVYAAKQISLEKVTPKLIERLIAEIKIQFYLKHENCLQLYKFYKQNKTLYLILEIGECSLFDLLRQKRFFSERQTAYYIRQTINAIKYLHENGIIHRDLKPENIVLVNNTVKLADFGWSIYTGSTKRTTFCGTLDYVSPEIVMGSEYDEMVDVWSIGVLCYELCTGHAPFQSTKSRQETYRKILNVELKFPRHVSKDAQDFIRRLLHRKPECRMSLQECLDHSWLKQYEHK